MTKGIYILGLLLACTAMQACCTPKVVYKTEVRTEYRDRVVHDTAEVEIPVIIEKSVTRDTVSTLENPYARSNASVSDGFLNHSLETKPQKIRKPVEVHVTDTVYIEKGIVEKEVPVEKELSAGQKMKLNLFWWLFSYSVLSLLWFLRKPLIELIKRI